MSIEISSPSELWQAAVHQIEGQINKPSFESFVKAMRPVSFQGDTFTFSVPNRLAKEWIESRYLSLIQTALRGIAGRPVSVNLAVTESQSREDSAPPRERLQARAIDGLALSPKYTFDTFVVGGGNRFAHAAARAVAEAPARA